jgi:hypothetical protein
LGFYTGGSFLAAKWEVPCREARVEAGDQLGYSFNNQGNWCCLIGQDLVVKVVPGGWIWEARANRIDYVLNMRI